MSAQSTVAARTRQAFKWFKPDSVRTRTSAGSPLPPTPPRPRPASTRKSLMQITPLAAAIVLAVGFCGYSLVRNLATNPDIYIRKDRRSDHDDSAGERMRRQAEAYGTRSVFRSFGHIQGGRNSGFWKEVEKKKAEGKSEETAVAEVVKAIKEEA